MSKRISSLAHEEFCVVPPTSIGQIECTDRRHQLWYMDHFSISAKYQWVSLEALNEVDR